MFGILCFSLFGFCILYHFATKKYLNPYKLYLVFGKKGSGKSTFLAKKALDALKRGKTVFTTEHIPGTYQIDASKDIGRYDFPAGSVILIDEASLIWDNRKYKSFEDHVRDWFVLQRHRHLEVYCFSQGYNIDAKLRLLTDEMYLVRKYFRVFSVARRIDKVVVLNNSTAEAPSSIDENLSFVPLWAPNAIKITFIPAWTKYFDSFVAPALLPKKFEYINPLEITTLNLRERLASILPRKKI